MSVNLTPRMRLLLTMLPGALLLVLAPLVQRATAAPLTDVA